MRRTGVNGAALAKLIVTIVDFTALYMIASRLKAFSLRDWYSGHLLGAFVSSAALFLAVGIIAHLPITIPVAIALLFVTFVGYVVAFWMFAVDGEDRAVIRGLWAQRFSIIGRKPMPPVVPVLESDPEAQS